MEHTQAYFGQEVNAECRDEIHELVDAGHEAALQERLGCRLAFGTAGLRGPMRGGYNGMNDLVMIQTTQGLASYLIEQFGEQVVKAHAYVGDDGGGGGMVSCIVPPPSSMPYPMASGGSWQVPLRVCLNGVDWYDGTALQWTYYVAPHVEVLQPF